MSDGTKCDTAIQIRPASEEVRDLRAEIVAAEAFRARVEEENETLRLVIEKLQGRSITEPITSAVPVEVALRDYALRMYVKCSDLRSALQNLVDAEHRFEKESGRELDDPVSDAVKLAERTLKENA